MVISRFSPREIRSILFGLVDWIFIGGTALVAFSLSRIEPNLRPFSPSDPAISYPHQHHAKVPTPLLATISTIIPGVIIIITVLLLPSHRQKTLKNRLWLLNISLLGLGLSVAAAMIVTDGMKNLVGKPRPDLLARCIVDPERLESGRYWIKKESGLLSAEVCTTWYTTTVDGLRKKHLLDGFRSWVSGHASISFSGLTYLTIFLYSHTFQALLTSSTKQNNAHPFAPLLLLFSIPILVAIYVSTTRYSDYRHHGVDIILGALLGTGLGFLGWIWYGARGVYGKRRLGGFSSGGLQHCKCDVESASSEPNGHHPYAYRENSIRNGNAEATGEHLESPKGEPQEGALQLREVSLSISTIDGINPGHVNGNTASRTSA